MKTVGQIKTSTVGGNVLIQEDKHYYPVYKLGIQAPPSSKFTINNSGTITMGSSGIYELDLSNLGGQIFSLVFTELNFTELNGEAIIDIVYEGEGQ